MSDLARALLDELAGDPVALARLRELAATPIEEPPLTAAAYTVATLAAELGRKPGSIRAAISRGELGAVKRGRGYVISRAAVAAWAHGETRSVNGRVQSPREQRPRSGPGPMRRALKRNPA